MKDSIGWTLFALAAWSGVLVGVLALLGVIDVGVPHHPGSNIVITATSSRLWIHIAIFLPMAIVFTVVAVRVHIASRTPNRDNGSINTTAHNQPDADDG